MTAAFNLSILWKYNKHLLFIQRTFSKFGHRKNCPQNRSKCSRDTWAFDLSEDNGLGQTPENVDIFICPRSLIMGGWLFSRFLSFP